MDSTQSGQFKVGDQVLVLNPHPHAGKTGRVIGFETLALIAHRGPRPKLELQDGSQCFLTRDTQAKLHNGPTGATTAIGARAA